MQSERPHIPASPPGAEPHTRSSSGAADARTPGVAYSVAGGTTSASGSRPQSDTSRSLSHTPTAAPTASYFCCDSNANGVPSAILRSTQSLRSPVGPGTYS